VFAGSATFTPAVPLIPAAGVVIQITGSGTCYGADVPLGESVSFSPIFGGTAFLASCAVGEGNLGGSLAFGTGIPAGYVGGATYIGGPATATLTIATQPFVGTATLVWSNPAAIAACPLSGTTTTPLTGTFTFVAT